MGTARIWLCATSVYMACPQTLLFLWGSGYAGLDMTMHPLSTSTGGAGKSINGRICSQLGQTRKAKPNSHVKLIYSSFSSQLNSWLLEWPSPHCLVYKYHQISLLNQWWARYTKHVEMERDPALTEIRSEIRRPGRGRSIKLWRCKSLTLFYTYTYVLIKSY